MCNKTLTALIEANVYLGTGWTRFSRVALLEHNAYLFVTCSFSECVMIAIDILSDVPVQ